MTDAVKRKRSRIACEPCRERKRKCNGENPCDTCSQFDYQCYFDSHLRKKRTTGLALSTLDDYQSDASPPGRGLESATHVNTVNAQSHLRSMEANSGAAFMRKLALKMDPVNAPKLSLFAWNLGSRGEYTPNPRTIFEVIAKPEMLALSAVYFEKIHPVFGFIDRDAFLKSVEKGWQAPPSSDSVPNEAVLCGVAALACLFSYLKPEPKELELAKRARLLLEQSTSRSAAPSLYTVTGWLLRSVYLRLTAPPHLAWMASCATMHMIEAAGLHIEPSPDSILHRPADDCDPETRRRLFGVAHHLNIWISFDMGRSRVAIRGISSLPPSQRPGDVTTQLLEFLPLSESLDPDRNPDSPELEAVLATVLDGIPSHQASALTQCNLVLCVYRRLRALNHNISGQLLDKVLASCARGIRSAREMLEASCPWHHIAYAPFQIICTLLAIDTRASLNQLTAAMECLGAVAAIHDTDAMKEAYSTARLLILLHQKRKEEDAMTLSGVLNLGWQPQPPSIGESTSSNLQPNNAAMTYSWLDDLTTEMPTLQDFDWNQFLSDDASWYMNMPNGNMPNGNMQGGNMPNANGNMHNTNMTDSSMSNPSMSNPSMANQNMSNQNMSNQNMQSPGMSNLKLTNLNIPGVNMQNSSMQNGGVQNGGMHNV